jgi:hypothetical protein
MKRIIVGTAGHFTTQFDYDEVKAGVINKMIIPRADSLHQVEAFLNKKLEGVHIRAVPQTLEQIEMNIDWLSRNRHTVIEWLHKETESY